MQRHLFKLMFLSFTAGIFLCSFKPSLQLKTSDVRATMEEMLAYHVEYKQFSSFIAKRSLKVYIEQFDPERTYLLASETRPYLDPKDDRLRSVVQNYVNGNLSDYATLNQSLVRAIERAKTYRQEIEKELILSKEEPQLSFPEPYLDYAGDEKELKARIKKQLVRALAIEKKAIGTRKPWDTETRKKVFELWEKRFARIESSYLNAGNEHYLCLHVLKAMAKSLDAHTSYFSPEEAFEMRTSLEKQFEGIGVILREGVDGVVIHDLVKGGPAERSGKISSGDLLIEINGKSLTGVSYEEILKMLQGDSRGRVQLGLKRYISANQSQEERVELKREKIVMQDERVQYTAEPFADGIIGKLILPSFYESGEGSSCELDIREALRNLKKQGNLLGLVIDMRDNSGGFLNQAVKVAGLFISSGVIVISKYSQGETQYLRDLDGRIYYDGPLIILTSKASASAAEIVAQALQDYGTALVIGDERTYGKGTIQYQTVTDPSASTFFKVTVGRYYTVSGRSTQIDGVKADMIVPTAYSALNIGERYLEFPLKSDRIPSVYSDPLTDVPPRNRPWFQKNYLPNLQKKLSLWTQMLSQLKENSLYRLQKNKDYALFLNALNQDKKGRPFTLSAKMNWGVDDLQLLEAIKILKDMALIQASSRKSNNSL